jgi:enoyl-CoA hydratase/carnithine racemase
LQASGKAFCASGDVNKMGDFTPASGRHLLKLAHRMVRNLANIKNPWWPRCAAR